MWVYILIQSISLEYNHLIFGQCKSDLFCGLKTEVVTCEKSLLFLRAHLACHQQLPLFAKSFQASQWLVQWSTGENQGRYAKLFWIWGLNLSAWKVSAVPSKPCKRFYGCNQYVNVIRAIKLASHKLLMPYPVAMEDQPVLLQRLPNVNSKLHQNFDVATTEPYCSPTKG